jgi:hypothetical protein
VVGARKGVRGKGKEEGRREGDLSAIVFTIVPWFTVTVLADRALFEFFVSG